jgi:hypothetical protein
VSDVIYISLELTITVIYDPELDFLKQNWFMSVEWGTRNSLPPFLPCTEICVVVIETSLELTISVTCDPELEFLKENWVISAEWSTLDSLRALLPCTEISVRGNTDITGKNSYDYL